ncbi:MAG: chromosomal replication initiator protein DnaA [Kiritimatiellae bacterium]|nr:chromosomal replication initiator protein DnaA [Kiritimatiellia bacterium]
MDKVIELWQKACTLLKRELAGNTYEVWIGVLKAPTLSGKTFVFAVDNEFQADWLGDNYAKMIADALCAAGAPAGIDLSFTVAPQEPVAPAPPPAEIRPPVATPAPARRPGQSAQEAALNPEFTFENFVTGPSNSWAYNAAGEVARRPGRAYNPLFIYGPTGIGKTHLMQAIGHRILEKGNGSIRYVTCEAMLNDYVDCVSHKENFDNFRKRYRRTDVLMVDDIQFLTGKEGLQEEFFNTYNELYTRHKQIIMTSDRPPKEIAGLTDRLVSRFGEGLVTQIECPNFETRLAILRYKQSSSEVRLSDELLTFIANNITSNVRALEGALTSAISYLSLSGNAVLTLDELRGLLKDRLDTELKKDLTCDEIKQAVAAYYNLRLTDMSSHHRQRSVAEPRQLAMFLCRKLTKRSLPEIGNNFGKTHATAYHSCMKIQGRLGMERELFDAAAEITRQLGRDPAVLMQVQD